MGSSSRALALTVNGGSSSVRFAFYEEGPPLRRRLHGKLDLRASETLLDWLERQPAFAEVAAVGHRIVHGREHAEPVPVTDALLRQLRALIPDDPQHLPLEIELMEGIRRRHPSLLQIACFDTAFHRSLPTVARLLPIPRRFDEMKIRRYGFHGLSYAYLMEELGRVAGAAAQGRVILAHLGHGSSLAAVASGRCVDTTMGFSPTGGLPMGTRSGDLDPGVFFAMLRADRLSPEALREILNSESGLLGLSGTTADVRDLLEREAHDPRAAEALDVFCYQVRKGIGAFAAVLGGLDTLVFSGGVGENSAAVRSRACRGLDFLGLELDEHRNQGGEPIISTLTSKVLVRVIPTNEELMIARAAFGFTRRLPLRHGLDEE